MTLLVGVLCKDGAVIAADRQISHGTAGAPTVGQAGTKVRILKDAKNADRTALYASSGPVGLGQQFSGLIEANIGRLDSNPYFDGIGFLQTEIRKILAPAFEMARLAMNVMPPQQAVGEVMCGSLLAMKFGDGVKLTEISPQGAFEHLSEAVPFVCIGSGKQNADPFLRFIWSTLWPQKPEQLPQLLPMRDAVLAAYWTVSVVSELRAPGVGMGCDVFVLEGKAAGQGGKMKYAPRQVPPEELSEHDSFIAAGEDALRALKAPIAGEGQAKPAPEPPKMEAAVPPPAQAQAVIDPNAAAAAAAN